MLAHCCSATIKVVCFVINKSECFVDCIQVIVAFITTVNFKINWILLCVSNHKAMMIPILWFFLILIFPVKEITRNINNWYFHYRCNKLSHSKTRRVNVCNFQLVQIFSILISCSELVLINKSNFMLRNVNENAEFL